MQTLEQKRATQRAWYHKTKHKTAEKNRAKARQYYHKNKEKGREGSRLWRAKNPEKYKANCHRHANRWLAKKHGLVHPESDRQKELEIFQLCREMTKSTGVKHVVDHIIPLCVGGWHHHLNLQVIPQKENTAKHSNPFWEHPEFKTWRDVPKWLWPSKMIPSYEALFALPVR